MFKGSLLERIYEVRIILIIIIIAIVVMIIKIIIIITIAITTKGNMILINSIKKNQSSS